MIFTDLFLSFFRIGLFSVGGGYAAIPLIRNETVVLRGWLTSSEFMDLATIAEMTPGPILINGATFAGMKVAGLPGALAASFGSVLPSLIIVSFLAWIYRKYREMSMLKSVLSALRPAVVALIASAGLNMFIHVAFGGRDMITPDNVRWAGFALFAAAFFILRKWKPGPIPVMALCGAGGLLLGMLGWMN